MCELEIEDKGKLADAAMRMLQAKYEEVDQLRAALAFYADPASWSKDDWGVLGVINPPDYGDPGLTARQALEGC